MNVIDTAKDVVGRIVDNAPRPATRQTVTVACTAAEAEALWCDPERLSVLLGDLGRVDRTAPDRYDWTLRTGDDDIGWQSELHSDPAGLRFSDRDGNRLTVALRPAPQERGVEMTVTAVLPAPPVLAGAALFTVLYRARALLQTGEVPTIAANPSARSGSR